MAEPSRAGWHGLSKEKRVCANCGKPLTLREPGGIWFKDMQGMVVHGDCERAAKEKLPRCDG